ncbi:MAG: TraB/GumN family protein [Polyangiaceae bacterium]|nr:TraB/GumN family protein [Polyangiaceae bacterium]
MHARSSLALRLCLLLLFGLLPACSSTAASSRATSAPRNAVVTTQPASATRQPEQAAAEQRGRGLFYRVGQGAAVVYLLGSIHVGSSDLYPMRPEIENAFNAADVAVVEIALDEQSTQQMKAEVMRAMTYPEGDSLQAHLSAETKTALQGFLHQSGLPEQMFMHLKPWAAAVLVTTLELQKAEYSAENGMDLYFQRQAAQRGKPVVALETAQQQLELLAAIDESMQDLMLRESLSDRKTLPQTMSDALAAWKRGDAEGLARALLEPMRTAEYQALFDRVFLRRNQRMAEAVEGYLAKGGKHFVIVGSGHLVGQGGVVDLLRRAGHTVQQR